MPPKEVKHFKEHGMMLPGIQEDHVLTAKEKKHERTVRPILRQKMTYSVHVKKKKKKKRESSTVEIHQKGNFRS
jgi:hypothetical protein